MDNQEIFEAVRIIFHRVVSGTTEVRPGTASRDVRAWDSLNHVMLISEIEKHFGIRFDLIDMLEMRTIADICHGVEEQLKEK